MSKVAAATTVAHVSDSTPTAVPVQKNARPRIAWIDIAKGVTILSVIASHVLAYGGTSRNLIFSFHMPLFFILSGYTMKPAQNWKDLWKRTKKDFVRLIIPTIFIQIMRCTLEIILHGASLNTMLYEFGYKMLWAEGVTHAAGTPQMGMAWFLVSLFVAKLIIRLLSLILKDYYKYICILLGFLGMVMAAKHIYLPLNLASTLVATMFIASGMMICKNKNFFSKYKLPIFIVSCLILYETLKRGLYIEMAVFQFSPITIIEAYASTFIVCILCRAISDIKIIHKVLCFIGVHTMSIFIVHNLDGYFNFLYKDFANDYVRAIVRTFWVLLYAWAFTVVFHGICRCLRFLRNRHIKRKVVA